MVHFRSGALKGLIAAALAVAAQASNALVLSFDDLNGYLPPGPPTIQEEWFTANYNGLKFGTNSPTTNAWFYSQRAIPGVYGPASGNTFASTDFNSYSGNTLEALGAGQTITSTTDFRFDGAYFSGFDEIQFKLYNNGVLVFTSAVSATLTDVPVFISSGYAGFIDEIDILGTQGFYAMDDMTLEFAQGVPEPAGLALVLMAGLAGAVASRRKR